MTVKSNAIKRHLSAFIINKKNYKKSNEKKFTKKNLQKKKLTNIQKTGKVTKFFSL